MQAGDLRRRITIQSKSVSRNTVGDEVITWPTLATVWAAVEPALGREYLEGRSREAEITIKIRIRYRSGVKPTMRVTHGSSTYEVVSVQEVRTERRELVLMCREAIDA